MSRMDTLKDALRLLRTNRGLAQSQIAEALGVPPSTVSAWETGKRQPSLHRLGQLADVLELDLGDLDDALELAGALPVRRRPPVDPQPDADRLARQLLNRPRQAPVDPAQDHLRRLLQGVFELATLLRDRLQTEETGAREPSQTP